MNWIHFGFNWALSIENKIVRAKIHFAIFSFVNFTNHYFSFPPFLLWQTKKWKKNRIGFPYSLICLFFFNVSLNLAYFLCDCTFQHKKCSKLHLNIHKGRTFTLTFLTTHTHSPLFTQIVHLRIILLLLFFFSTVSEHTLIKEILKLILLFFVVRLIQWNNSTRWHCFAKNSFVFIWSIFEFDSRILLTKKWIKTNWKKQCFYYFSPSFARIICLLFLCFHLEWVIILLVFCSFTEYYVYVCCFICFPFFFFCWSMFAARADDITRYFISLLFFALSQKCFTIVYTQTSIFQRKEEKKSVE